MPTAVCGLVNLILRDDEEIARLARYINSKYPEWDMSRIKHTLEYLSFIWTMVNIEQIVDAINVPEITEAVNKRSNPGSYASF